MQEVVFSGKNNVAEIGSYSFSGCCELTGFSFGENLTEIKEHTFEYCTKLSLSLIHISNYDILGMADLSADYLRLTDREVLSVTAETQDGKDGFGRVGELPRKMSLKECGEFVKNALSLNDVKIYGDPDTQVEKAAICTGSGKSMISDALAKGAQVYVTGDIDHHTGIDAVAQGLTIVDAGHYGTEYIFMKAMEKVLKEQYPNLQITCAKVQSPYMIL